jgi:hypothetical protein
MQSDYDFRPLAYVLIAIGCVLAAITAVVPNYDAGHKLMFSVFLAGIVPYYVYGCLTERLRGWALLIPGLVVVAVHAWLTVSQRFLGYDGYADGMIYYGPVLLTFGGLPAGIAAGRLIDSMKSLKADSKHLTT